MEEMLGVLAVSSQRLRFPPPPTDDEATLHLPDRKPREARGKGGRQMVVSSPHSGWSFRTWMEVG